MCESLSRKPLEQCTVVQPQGAAVKDSHGREAVDVVSGGGGTSEDERLEIEEVSR